MENYTKCTRTHWFRATLCRKSIACAEIQFGIRSDMAELNRVVRSDVYEGSGAQLVRKV